MCRKRHFDRLENFVPPQGSKRSWSAGEYCPMNILDTVSLLSLYNMVSYFSITFWRWAHCCQVTIGRAKKILSCDTQHSVYTLRGGRSSVLRHSLSCWWIGLDSTLHFSLLSTNILSAAPIQRHAVLTSTDSLLTSTDSLLTLYWFSVDYLLTLY